jgi:DNA-directed RNA polymerase subunit beta
MIAQANIEMDEDGKITADRVIAREDGDFPVVEPIK